jgi:hypothetical protein
MGVFLILAVAIGWRMFRPAVAAPAPPQAAKNHDAGMEAVGEAKAHAQVAQARDLELQAARAKVLTLEAALATFRAKAPEAPSSGLAVPDQRDQVILKQDGVIQAQDDRADLLEAQVATRTAEALASDQASVAFRLEGEALRKSLRPIHTRALGGIWNPADQTYGVFYEQDVWRVRLGVDVLQQRLPVQAGGGVHNTVQVRAGFTL